MEQEGEEPVEVVEQWDWIWQVVQVEWVGREVMSWMWCSKVEQVVSEQWELVEVWEGRR